jgi:hypothetical protein
MGSVPIDFPVTDEPHDKTHQNLCNRKRKQSIKKKLVQKAKQIKKTLKKAARAVTRMTAVGA